MNIDTIISVFGFAFFASVTPGPNNFMLLSSGVNFGFLKTIPHMLGIIVGFVVLITGVGLGIGALLQQFPQLFIVLKILGGAYLLYIAWKIGSNRSFKKQEGSAKAMSFFEAAIFQWVNPKAWVMSVSAVTIYSSLETPYLNLMVIVSGFLIASLVSVTSWTVFGTYISIWLSNPVRLKWFNITMGVLLACTLWPMLA